jgi:hypothetical protein
MDRVCNVDAEKRRAYMLLVGKPEGQRLLGKLRRKRWITIRFILER